MEDEKIVQLYLNRDEAAIQNTAVKYGPRLRSLSFGITSDEQTAEECENDTYLKAWNRIPPCEPKTYFYAFLARITRFISIDRCRELCGFHLRGTGYQSSQAALAHQEQAVAAEIEKYYRKAKEILAANHDFFERVEQELAEKKLLTMRDLDRIRGECGTLATVG